MLSPKTEVGNSQICIILVHSKYFQVLNNLTSLYALLQNICLFLQVTILEALPDGRGGGSHVACLNFKTSHVSVYKCLSLIVGFAITVAIWLREVVSCHDFILRAVATFWAMSLVGIYPGRASFYTEPITHQIGCGLKVFAKFLLPKIATVSIFP